MELLHIFRKAVTFLQNGTSRSTLKDSVPDHTALHYSVPAHTTFSHANL